MFFLENTTERSRNGRSAARAAAGTLWRRTEAEEGGRRRVRGGGAWRRARPGALLTVLRLPLAPLGCP